MSDIKQFRTKFEDFIRKIQLLMMPLPGLAHEYMLTPSIEVIIKITSIATDIKSEIESFLNVEYPKELAEHRQGMIASLVLLNTSMDLLIKGTQTRSDALLAKNQKVGEQALSGLGVFASKIIDRLEELEKQND